MRFSQVPQTFFNQTCGINSDVSFDPTSVCQFSRSSSNSCQSTCRRGYSNCWILFWSESQLQVCDSMIQVRECTPYWHGTSSLPVPPYIIWFYKQWITVTWPFYTYMSTTLSVFFTFTLVNVFVFCRKTFRVHETQCNKLTANQKKTLVETTSYSLVN